MPPTIENTDCETDSLSSNEITALFSLLDDADIAVTDIVIANLAKAGGYIAPKLRTLIESSSNSVIRCNAQKALHSLQYHALGELKSIIGYAALNGMDPDIEQSAIALAKFGYPELQDDRIISNLDQIALSVHEEFIRSNTHSELGHVLALNIVFFNKYGYHGAEREYYNPDFSYINTVAAKKIGIPITLSLLYMLIGERTGLDLYGVGMPMHFIVYAPAIDTYLDVFNGGTFISRSDCRNFIEKNGVKFQENMLNRIENISMILRMIRNLSYSHSRCGNIWEAETLMRFHSELLGNSLG